MRANSIFRKLEQSSGGSQEVSTGSGSDGVATPARVIADHQEAVAGILEGEAGDEIWSLLMLAARLDDSNAQAAISAEPAVLAKYTFNLAKAFNLFYHRHRIIAEENEIKRAVLTAVADYTRRQLTAALATLGILVPERM